ncbi:hypothetical protein [Bacteroides pyogenes]|uniref:Toxin-antitoxin system, antitoxin component domain protein n=1 Tax=Bacteroides pyogenes F0041 TaxID=1321819 RepID=U2CLS8_9BACE|nr:hypothetical protein [Bacteroides pyogenes]GAE21195.1 hypothetical protein JCM10003_613 [Bacteroides pyogenes JCM 10003]ERI85033.1 toxin-antitoxin system, antitoxin component domain protein [Bacteroides pyogenes F0041]MBB3894439.1 ribosomal protein L20A (L18A) [Bacteroides pyogenes]MBR8726560.1 hypothetical protein [Bacteroides pyogenes]MBR8739940.1 hypothetical protein [Bacteroides pyogenes]
MKLIKALQLHVAIISKYQGVSLDKEIAEFCSEHQNLDEKELLEKVYAKYGSRIKFLEDAARCKSLINIKEWVATLGVFFIIGLIAYLIYFASFFIK